MFKMVVTSFFWGIGSILFLANQSMAQLVGSSEENAITLTLLSDKTEMALENFTTKEKECLVGLAMEAKEGWHFYWAGIGTELLEPTITWELPEGLRLEPVNHPKPRLFDYGGFTGYGYDGRMVFLYRLIHDGEAVGAKNFAFGDVLKVSATVEWVSCKELCVFGSEVLSLDWRISDRDTITEESDFLNSLLLNKGSQGNQTLENRFLEMGVLGWLMAAFLGGLILNLMPCVLPVLSIKIFSLMEHAGEAVSKRAFQGFVYALGVVLSFIVLAILLMGLRSIGQEVGWGFQLQDPFFITFLIILFFLLGLNMLGVFELGTSLVGLSSTAFFNRNDWVGSFVTGILAAVVGAPCVGPFIGGVSGIALQVDTELGILIFAFMGLGMAFPFLLLALMPSWLRFFPKPGVWMERLRQVMGGLLIVSTGFLVWVVEQSVGAEGLIIVLGILFFVGFASYLFGRWGAISQSKQRQRRAKFVSLILIVLPGVFGSLHLAGLYGETDKEAEYGQDGLWEKWSEELVEEALESGHGVFIDFTASWCLICQSNKALVLRKEKTESLFQAYGIRWFVADWTQNDPAITRALEADGRSGVPLYLLKSPSGVEEILPQNLSYSLLETAVEALFSGE